MSRGHDINLNVPKPPPHRLPAAGADESGWEYLAETDRFEIDRAREKFFLSVRPERLSALPL